MATSGTDGLMKVWDIRAFKPVYKYRMKGRPAHCLAISQRGMLAAAFGPQVYVSFLSVSDQKLKDNCGRIQHVIPGLCFSIGQILPGFILGARSMR